MQSKTGIYKLKGKVQHYAWGGFDYIPQLLGVQNDTHQPFAEYWMGAHPSASATIEYNGGQSLPLNDLIAAEPSTFIGDEVNDTFHELPYLFKILDVKEMLSIQVHPSRQEAIKGFDREEAAGISINAPHRNYKDRNHKPEVMVALSEFYLLHGFKQPAAITQVLQDVAAFNFLLPVFEKEGYRGLYETIMEMPQPQVDGILAPLISGLLKHTETLAKTEPGYWAAKLFSGGQPLENIDRGIFSIYLFNIMHVQPGEAVFQGAGVPHAYLEGQNVELMANSDNVLRGGLTPKHIDVPELMKQTRFEPVEPMVLTGELTGEIEARYPCPVPDFGISMIKMPPGSRYASESYSAEIFICTGGELVVEQNGLRIKKGESFLVTAQTVYTINSDLGAELFKAFVPGPGGV